MDSREEKGVEEKEENPVGYKNGKENSKNGDVNSYLHNLYYNLTSPVSFSGFYKIHYKIKRDGLFKVTPKYLKKWLSMQESYASHHPVIRDFKRPRVLAFSLNYQWDSDTANMVKYKDYNDRYSYFAVFIDIFSRFLYSFPLKTLSGYEMTKNFQRLIDEKGVKPKKLRSDQGSEYKNKDFERLLEEENIVHIFTYYKTKANYAERVIKTIKLKIFKYFTNRETFRWIDILSDLTDGYNKSTHRSIKMTPEEAQKSDPYKLWRNQYAIISYPKSYFSAQKIKKNLISGVRGRKKFKYNISDRVKIPYIKKTFDREYSEKWSGEIFTIIDRKINQNQPMYQLKDYNNDIIEGYFYEPELQIAYLDNDIVYKIEKILKKRTRNKKKEILVKWKGWPKKFNSWILEDTVESIKK